MTGTQEARLLRLHCSLLMAGGALTTEEGEVEAANQSKEAFYFKQRRWRSYDEIGGIVMRNTVKTKGRDCVVEVKILLWCFFSFLFVSCFQSRGCEAIKREKKKRTSFYSNLRATST